MTRTRSPLWKDCLATWFRRRSRRRAGCPAVERLEERTLLAAAVPAPEAVDDSYVIDSQVWEPEYGELRGTYFNVLDNDLTLANASQFASLEITKGPTGG